MAKEIYGFRLESLRVPAVREFMHSVQEAIASTEVVTQVLPAVYAQWKAAYDAMVAVYEVSLKSEDTELIRNLDERRDTLKTAIKTAADSYRRAEDDETRRHGTAVWDAFGSFRVDNNAQYNIETAQLDSLLGVLLGEQLRPSVKAMGLLPLVEELKSLNDRLHELVGIRDLENVNKPDGQRQEAMAAVIDAYRQLVKYVNAWNLINVDLAGQQNQQLALFIDLVNSIILRYRRNFPGASGSSRPEDGSDNSDNSDNDTPGSDNNTPGGDNTGDNTGDNNTPGGSGGDTNLVPDDENGSGTGGSNGGGSTGGSTGGGSTGGSGTPSHPTSPDDNMDL